MEFESADGQPFSHSKDDKDVTSHHGSSSADKTMSGHPKATVTGRGEGGLETEPRNETAEHPPPNEDEEMFREMTLNQEMELEKRRYPGAQSWAPDEQRLFETLFQRQKVSILPHHWTLDFGGAPMPENVFDGPDEKNAIVYAFRESDFAVTAAIQQLIFLTGNAIIICESGLDAKAPKLIKKGIEQFLKAVAQDAGYDNLEFIPNIFVELAGDLRGDHIGDYITTRMKSLAWLQQQFLRNDRTPDFWDDTAPSILHPEAAKQRFLSRCLQVKKRKLSDYDPDNGEGSSLESSDQGDDYSMAHSSKRQRFREETSLASRPGQQDELMYGIALNMQGSHLISPPSTIRTSVIRDPTSLRRSPASGISPRTKVEPETPSPPRIPAAPLVRYRHKPPVLYGLFVVNTNVFLLTIDSSQEQDAKVTYHLNMDFTDSKQSVWNALTIAIVACLAREHVREVMHYFDTTQLGSESDPDS